MNKLFISYSHRDKEFVDVLETDLSMRGFLVWRDQSSLKAGNNWLIEIPSAIRQSDVFILVVSPNSMSSLNVLDEYACARDQGKLIIPVIYKVSTQIFLGLNPLHRVEFEQSYELGISQLIRDITESTPASTPVTSESMSPLELEQNLVPIEHPKEIMIDKDSLYAQNIDAQARGELERAVALLQQIVELDSHYHNGQAAAELKRLTRDLYPVRNQRLRLQAKRAHREGKWEDAELAWTTLLKLDEQDNQAQDMLQIAKHNQQYEKFYENALRATKEGNLPAAKDIMLKLWKSAPFYGDPMELAVRLNLVVPLTYEQSHILNIFKITFAVLGFATGLTFCLIFADNSTAKLYWWLCGFVGAGIGFFVGVILAYWISVPKEPSRLFRRRSKTD